MKQGPNSFRFIKNGYIAILLLIVALGMEALIETRELARLTDQLYQHPFKVSNNLLEADRNIEQMRGLMKDVVAARSSRELDALVSQINVLEAGTNHLFGAVLEAFLGDKADVLEARKRFGVWQAHRAKVIQYMRQGRYGEASALHRNEGGDHAHRLSGSMEGLIDFVRSEARAFMREGQERRQKSRILVISTMVAVMLLASIISVCIVNSEKKAKRELVASEQRLSLAIDNMAVGIVVIEEDGTITEFNPFAELIFGYQTAEAIGQNIRILMPEPDRSGHDQYLRNYLDTETAKVVGMGREATGLGKNGETFPIRLRIGELKRADGSLYVYTINDLTEVKALEGQLRHSQKMEAIGQLTGGIAHDFNNILGIVMGNLEFLQEEVADDPKILGRIDKAIRGTQRGAELTKKLLGFSRQGPTQTKMINVNAFIESLHDLTAKSLTPSIAVEQHLAGDLWSVEIDPGDFEDAILNLALNARDAMPDGGNLVIETANKIIDEMYAKANLDARAGEFVMISLSDTGTGMTDEIREKVFEPFFSTKEQGKGTGLGLSMVYGFVKRSGGHVKVYSELERGTTIHLYLPRAHQHEAASGVEQPANLNDIVPRGSETILVVDDEEALVEVAVTYLEGLGYRTLRAIDGKQALNILEHNPGIDLVFSDVIMPGRLDGYELATAASEMGHNSKILLASGFTKKREEYVNGGNAAVSRLTGNLLGKPYNRQELAVAVRCTLDEENDSQT